MANIYPSSNLSDKEVFAINGQLPPERIERMLSNNVEARQISLCKNDLQMAENCLDIVADEIQALFGFVQGGNKSRVKEIALLLENARHHVKNAKGEIE